jgi:hypothetical protein
MSSTLLEFYVNKPGWEPTPDDDLLTNKMEAEIIRLRIRPAT